MRQKNIVAICSGILGYEQAWLAVNLAHGLTLLKKNMLLFELNGSMQNMAAQLNFPVSEKYEKMLEGRLLLNNAVEKYVKGHFDLIYMGSGQNLLQSYPVGRLQILARDLQTVAQKYDYAFVNCSGENVYADNIFLNLSSYVIVQMKAGYSSMTAVYQKMEQIKKVCRDVRIFVVVTDALSTDEGLSTFRLLENAVSSLLNGNLHLLGIVHHDGRIKESFESKELLMNRYAVSDCAENVFTLARDFMKGTDDGI